MSVALPVTQRGYYGQRQWTRVINEPVKFASLQGLGCYSVAKAAGEYASIAEVTLLGLVPGSDIVILDAGTDNEIANVDAHPGASFTYGLGVGAVVDFCLYRIGYVPWFVRGFTVPAGAALVPVAQAADRNYSNP